MENRITQGVIWKQLLLFFFPVWFGTFFQQLYNTADAVIVGNFVGKGALAAVGATGVILNLLVGFFVGLASGASVVVSQYYGGGDRGGVQRAVHTAMALGLVGGVGIMVVGWVASPWMLRVMNTPADIMADSLVYLRVCFLGMVPSLLYNVGTGVLRAVGDSRRPLNFLIVASLTNILLDLVFVAALGLGVLGVALGTVISQCVAAGLTLLSLSHTPASYRFQLKKLGFDRAILGQVMRIGLPAGLQSVMYSLSNMVVQTSINAFGLSITTFSGQNFGAKLYHRVKKGVTQCCLMAFVGAGILMVLALWGGPTLYRFFVADDAVITDGLRILHFLVPMWPAYVLIEVLSGAVRGTGDSLVPMVMTSFGVCLTRVLWIFAVATPFWPSLNGVLTCYPISWGFTSGLFLVYYLQGGWLRRRIRVQQAGEVAQRSAKPTRETV